MSDAREWPGGIAAITLFVEDIAAARRFYEEVFRLPVVFEDEVSAVFKFGDTLVNLLQASEGPELVAPANVASADAGVRFVGIDDSSIVSIAARKFARFCATIRSHCDCW